MISPEGLAKVYLVDAAGMIFSDLQLAVPLGYRLVIDP
jgi:hypothetical protein